LNEWQGFKPKKNQPNACNLKTGSAANENKFISTKQK